MLRTLLVAALLTAAPALAFELRTDSQGDVVRWSGRVEFVLDHHFAEQLGVPGARSAVAAAVAAVAARSSAVEVTLREGDGEGEVEYSRGTAAKNQNSIVVLTDWPYESKGLAVTLVTLNARTNLVLDADIAFNGEEFEFAIIDAPAPGETRYDLQNTLTHELLHALGLMHNPADSTAVMYPSAAPGETCKRTLGKDDIEGLGKLYDAALAGPGEAVPNVGCSSAPGAAPVALVAFGVLLLLRRRRASVACALASAAISSLALAAEPVAPGVEPEEIAWGEVVQASSRWLPDGRTIVTEVEVAVQRCVKGACRERSVRLLVLGGRVGDLEQVVAHHPKVERGSQVVLTKRLGRLRLTPAH